MIIICPSCEKKFVIEDKLIPNEGRLLQCGSCNQKWFFNKNDETAQETSENANKIDVNPKLNEKVINKNNITPSKKIEKKLIKDKQTPRKNKEITIFKDKKRTNFTLVNFLSYFLVLIISFIALIIILDTFKSPLYEIFPKFELVFYNFYETLKDIKLFIEDLF
tara:strand:+ start:62 stop:553 length:492 start_codon:yes stop_codon:yes gene_type:complete